jgi:hypothetical protein
MKFSVVESSKIVYEGRPGETGNIELAALKELHLGHGSLSGHASKSFKLVVDQS